MRGLGLRVIGLNVAATLGRQLGAGLLQLATMAIIARVYGPQGNGAYTVALLLPMMLAVFLNMGIGPANVFFLASGKVSPMTAWRKTCKLYAGLAVIGGFIGGLVLFFFSEDWFPGVPGELLWLAFLMFPFSLLLDLVSSIYQGLQQFKKFNVVLLLQPALTLAGVGLVAFSFTDAGGLGLILLAHLVSVIFTLVVSIYLLSPLLSDGKDEQPNYAKASLTYGVKAHLSNIVTFANYKADIFLVNLFVGPAAAGIYVIAVQLAERLWMLSTAVSTVLLPKLSQLTSDEEKKSALTPLACRWTLTLTFVGTIFFLIIARPLINLIFGADFSDVVLVVLLFAPGIVLWAGARVLSNDMASRGKPEINLYISLLVLVVNLVGNIILIPHLGILGAAISTSVAYATDFIAKFWVYSRVTRVNIRDLVLLNMADIKMINSFRGKML